MSSLEGTRLYGRIWDFSLSRAQFSLLNVISTDDLLKDCLPKDTKRKLLVSLGELFNRTLNFHCFGIVLFFLYAIAFIL